MLGDVPTLIWPHTQVGTTSTMDNVAVHTIVNITGKHHNPYKQNNIFKSGSTLNVVKYIHTLNMAQNEIVTLSKQSNKLFFWNCGLEDMIHRCEEFPCLISYIESKSTGSKV
jgi:hypothetical protein